ncbi:hypothetical protein SEA_ANTUNA_58 [Microbacterium phage Antuna]|nr:hypothetical protein SEA_BLETT_56 [Microbacterium phage Blett]URM87320.1 hypothetical protein SEA_ANTUNA_58 [Microbacterium phage Antuna]
MSSTDTKTFVRVERELVEARTYERSVEIELDMRPGQYATDAQTVLIVERSGSPKPYVNGRAISLRVQQRTKAGAKPRRGGTSSFDLLALVKGHTHGSIARVFTPETIERMRALALEVVAEFESIDWENVKP